MNFMDGGCGLPFVCNLSGLHLKRKARFKFKFLKMRRYKDILSLTLFIGSLLFGACTYLLSTHKKFTVDVLNE